MFIGIVLIKVALFKKIAFMAILLKKHLKLWKDAFSSFFYFFLALFLVVLLVSWLDGWLI